MQEFAVEKQHIVMTLDESPNHAKTHGGWKRLGVVVAVIIGLLVGGLVPPAHAGDPSDWVGGSGPVAFVTHIAADPTDSNFLLIFLVNSARRNPDQTQTHQGEAVASWALYYSVDGGKTWQPASNDLAEVNPTFLVMFQGGDGIITWVGTEAHGLWRSDNRGRTWRPIPIEGLANQRLIGMVQDVRGRLHLLTTDRTRYPATHLFSSRDDGRTWSHRQIQSYLDEPQATVTGILADPFDDNRLYLTTYGGLMLTENAGFTWKRITLPLPEGSDPTGHVVLAADPTQRGRLFLVRRGKDPTGNPMLLSFRSLDSGLTWERLPSRWTSIASTPSYGVPIPFSLKVDPLKRERLLLASNMGIWRSSDGGETWLPAGSELAGTPVRDVSFDARRKGIWIAIGAGGLWRSRNAGAVWETSVQGLPATGNIHHLIRVAGKSGVILALNGGLLPQDDLRHPVWRSDDGGRSWMPAMRGLGGANIRMLLAHPALPDTAFALTDQGIARTDNGGISWLQRQLNGYPLTMAIDPTAPGIYVGTGQGLLYSPDRGDNWHLVFEEGSTVAVTVDAAGTVFLASYSEGGGLTLWRGQPGKQSWQQVGPLPVQGAVQLAAHPTQPELLTLTSPWEGIFVSVDGGKQWHPRMRGIPPSVRWQGGVPQPSYAPNILALYMDPISGEWWASRDGGGVYHSVNNGATWEDATNDMGDTLILSFVHGPEGLLAGTANGGVFLLHQDQLPPEPPPQVDVKIEIFWPHGFQPVTTAKLANLGLRLYRARSLEPPPCAWTPNVDVWVARDAEPLRRLGLAEQRTVEGHPFPFWTMNDLDITWANDPQHQLIYLARVSPGLAESYSSVWVHAADARTHLPYPPQPESLAPSGVEEVDGRILVVWPHDEQGRFVPPEEAPLVNITAALFRRDTLQALRTEDLPDRVWLVGALDNQIGRRLAVGKPREVEHNGLRYIVYDFNDIDVSLARNPAHRWAFWLEAQGIDLTSNVWIHGTDARTIAPRMTEPITACQP